MLVVVYLDKGTVSDTPESSEIVISDTKCRQMQTKYKKKTNKQHMFKFTAAFSRYVQFLLADHRRNNFCLSKFFLKESQGFTLRFFLFP